MTAYDEHEELLSHLDERQRRDFENYGGFFVVSDDERVFWLHNGFEVIQFEDGGQAIGWHVYALNQVGMSSRRATRDVSLITQLLLLQTNSKMLIGPACWNGPTYVRTSDPPPMAGSYVWKS